MEEQKNLGQCNVDEKYMQRAIELAKKGCGFVAPNPMVGAVIVKDKRVIGEGYHARYGDLHAERNALKNCTESAEGATIYVTLEPCCHQGKQPPCVDALIEAKVKKVVVGSDDPNPLVAGKGIKRLREARIEVVTGVMKEACDALNPVFFYFIQNRRPYVVMKYAMTLDGKIATFSGDSRWITGEEARRHVHEDRHRYTAIMAGIGTVLADDPLLTCRIEGGKNPVRIICDTHLRTPIDSQIVRTAKEVPTILVVGSDCEKERMYPYEEKGCEILPTACKNGQIDLEKLMQLLGEKKIDSILLEGGGTLNEAALESHIISKVQAYVAPKLIGGRDAKTPIEGTGFAKMKDALQLKHTTISKLGEDYLIEGEVESCLPES